MIRPEDFEIQLIAESTGTVVRVTHIPTGNRRAKMATPSTRSGTVCDALIAELRGKLFDPDEVRIDVGRSGGGRDFISVTHLPSGIQRRAMRRERSEADLLDEVLNELYTDPQKLRQIQEIETDQFS